MLPKDQVLSQLLQSGGFETVLRVGSANGSAAISTAALLSRFPDLSGPGAAYLSERALAALSAAKSIADLDGDERIDYGQLPRVPSYGLPGVARGDIVFLSKSYGPGQGPRGTDMGEDAYEVYENPPTYDELFEGIRDREREREKSYERLAKWRAQHPDDVTTRVNAAFVVE